MKCITLKNNDKKTKAHRFVSWQNRTLDCFGFNASLKMPVYIELSPREREKEKKKEMASACSLEKEFARTGNSFHLKMTAFYDELK